MRMKKLSGSKDTKKTSSLDSEIFGTKSKAIRQPSVESTARPDPGSPGPALLEEARFRRTKTLYPICVTRRPRSRAHSNRAPTQI